MSPGGSEFATKIHEYEINNQYHEMLKIGPQAQCKEMKQMQLTINKL